MPPAIFFLEINSKNIQLYSTLLDLRKHSNAKCYDTENQMSWITKGNLILLTSPQQRGHREQDSR